MSPSPTPIGEDVHFYLGGSLMASHVRTQKSASLSSGESEFAAMVGGAAEAVFLKDCLDYILKNVLPVLLVLSRAWA